MITIILAILASVFILCFLDLILDLIAVLFWFCVGLVISLLGASLLVSLL